MSLPNTFCVIVLGVVGAVNDAADIAAYVVGEADVEELERAHIALFGASSGLCDEP
jgi:hypothetical protein